MKRELVVDILLWILFIMVIIGAVLVLIFVLTFTPKSMDDFCISKGYEKATDFKGRLINATSQIECDKLEIFDVENDIVCKEFDKWGDCKRSTYFYRD